MRMGRQFYPVSLLAPGTRQGSSGQPWRGIDVTQKGNHWRYTVEKLDILDSAGDIYWPTKGGMPRLKMYADQAKGSLAQDWWDDIPPINSQAKERTGYSTQKPLPLLNRIIRASSNPDDIVLDPFCGCGTAVVSSSMLGRRWIGIDIAHIAIRIIRNRLMAPGLTEGEDHVVKGEPTSPEDAEELARENRYEFQRWAVSRVHRAQLYQQKKGADGGIDGFLLFNDSGKDPKKCLIQVKSGHVGVALIREFSHVISREKAALGLFITLESPTHPMKQEAAAFGYYDSSNLGMRFPRMQIRTVEELLGGKPFELPPPGVVLGFPQAGPTMPIAQIALDI